MKLQYLKSNIKAEPLIWKWYAWSYLISPVTAACNIVERHLKIMNSYIQAPEIHAQAVKNPKLAGGPFIDLDNKYVEEIKQLIEVTKRDCSSLIKLATSLKECDRMLQTEAKGDSLEDLYKQIPNNLKGLIELIYDLNNHPSIRIIEELFYHKYYTHTYQSISLSLVENDFRPFILSTPRLKREAEVLCNVPFSDTRLDRLFSMRFTPGSCEEIENLLEIPPEDKILFRSFFTESSPDLDINRNYTGESLRVRYFGHACVLLETKDVSILIDPVISYQFSTSLPRFTYNDLPDKIDYVVLTHNHQDHVLLETLLQLRYKIKNIVFPSNQKGALADPSLKLILKRLGFSSLISLDDLEKLPIPHGEIIGIPFLGEHSDLNIQTKLAYFINLKNRKFLFAADSNNIDSNLYKYIFDYIGEIDTLFIGMECDGAPLSWLYGPLLTTPLNRSFDKTRSLSGSNFEKAWPIVEKSGCKRAYIYAMGQEPWLNYIMTLKYSEDSIQIMEARRLLEACKNKGIESELLYTKKEWHH